MGKRPHKKKESVVTFLRGALHYNNKIIIITLLTCVFFFS